jgi:hypothetical protein
VRASSPAEQAAALKRQDAAHRRLLSSVKALAVVRRLLTPPVSPWQVAARLGAGEAAAGLRRSAAPAEGVGVLN